MKKLWLLLTITILLFGCAGKSEGSLDYQKRDCTFTGVCELADGSYTLKISTHPDGSGELEFLTPETLTGCRYLRTAGGEYSFATEDCLFPVAANPTVEAIFGLFALRESDLISAKLSESTGQELNILTFEGDIKVYLSSDSGLPLRFEHPLLVLNIHENG